MPQTAPQTVPQTEPQTEPQSAADRAPGAVPDAAAPRETAGTEILLIRHAPARHGGCLAGRRDVAADLPPEARLKALRAAVGAARLLASPARRCVETALALWPEGAGLATDARLWEQDFGAWEGRAFADLPDLGALAPAALAAHVPPGGESFAALCARTAPALCGLGPGRVAIVAHAGTVRAALALATGSVAGALAFQVAPLSLTRIFMLPGGQWSVAEVNRSFP